MIVLATFARPNHSNTSETPIPEYVYLTESSGGIGRLRMSINPDAGEVYTTNKSCVEASTHLWNVRGASSVHAESEV
jgi:hypothetical protein